MSTFRVDLNNTQQGLLDIDPSTQSDTSEGSQFATSYQRTVYVMGPNRIMRKLKDGETFTDCNYWKRFAYPQATLEDAFITVVSDDGSSYVDGGDNTFPVTWLPGAAEDGIIVGGDGPSDTNMSYDVLSTHGGAATFTQIKNLDNSNSVQVTINDTATFTLEANSDQIFNNGDIAITKLAFDNTASGASSVSTVEVLFGIPSICTS